jgi:hypothetical protein
MISRTDVASGYADLMGRFALPLFLTQTFTNRAHPETVEKAHRHTLNLLNRELHGNNWRRRGIIGAQSIMGIERHKSGFPHSHAVIGHPDLDLGAKEYSALRRSLRLTCEAEWGFSKLEVAKSPAHCNAYVSKYICKDGEIVLTADLQALHSGILATQASLIAA